MSVSPAVMKRLMREISELKRSPPEGIRIQTNEDNMLDVTGVIEGPEGTPYAGGYFRVKFKFTDEFPAAPPKCWFATKIFHPNVSTAGEICVNTLKKDWQSSYGIGHILLTVKCLLIYPNPESALDEEAGKLLLEDYKSYCDRAKLITGVHARSRPPEFASSDTMPSGSGVASTSATMLLPPIPTPPVFSLPTPIASSTTTSTSSSRKSSSPAPQSQSQNASTTKLSVVEKQNSSAGQDKERHVSPSPLSTADANVTGGAGSGTKAAVGGVSGTAVGVSQTKAVKRSATSNATTGAEKRKKALKRL